VYPVAFVLMRSWARRVAVQRDARAVAELAP
jgi:hypothetical protein